MKKLIVAQNIGFCFGVKRTVETAEILLKEYGEVYSIGDIVHNPLVMEKLKSKGLKVVNSADEIAGKRFIIRSHGIGQGTLDYIRKKGIRVFDATCPSVRKIQSLIKKLDNEKYFIIIIGDEKHPEVIGLKEYGKRTIVFGNGSRVPIFKKEQKVAIIGQTTVPFEEYIRKAGYIARRSSAGEVVIYNTICKVTGERQKEAVDISRKVDAVVVLGGRNSSNTAKLYKTARRYNRNVFYIERIKDIENIPFLEFDTVGIVSGTSTPEGFIKEVGKKIMEV